MTDTPSNSIPYVPENVLDPAAGLNLALVQIDGLIQLSVEAIQNDPPATPANGERYIVGGTPTGAWVGEEGRVAQYIEDGDYWRFFDAFIAVDQGQGALIINVAGTWLTISPDP